MLLKMCIVAFAITSLIFAAIGAANSKKHQQRFPAHQQIEVDPHGNLAVPRLKWVAV